MQDKKSTRALSWVLASPAMLRRIPREAGWPTEPGQVCLLVLVAGGVRTALDETKEVEEAAKDEEELDEAKDEAPKEQARRCM